MAKFLVQQAASLRLDEIYQFSPHEKKFLLEGIHDADNGNSYNQQESDKMISKWLQEKSSGLLEH